MAPIRARMKLCEDIKTFVGLAFKTQLHQCCQMYCMANGLSAYVKGRPSSDYFKCRAYLMKIPTQDIKNIAIMLMKEKKPVYLYSLQDTARAYVEQERAAENKKRIEEMPVQKSYDMDSAVLDFLKP